MVFLLDGDAIRRLGGFLGNGDIHRRVGLDGGHLDVQHRKPALIADDVAGKLHAAEIPVIAISCFDQRVADTERHFSAAIDGYGMCFVGERRFQKTLRAGPDFRGALLDRSRLRGYRGIVSGHVPGGVAAEVLINFLQDRRRTIAAGFDDLAASDLYPAAPCIVIDVGRIVFHLERRPG